MASSQLVDLNLTSRHKSETWLLAKYFVHVKKRWHLTENYGMLILIQSLIFCVNVYFPELQRWPDQTRGNTSFWKFDQSYFDRVQHPMIYDGVQILHHVWPGSRSRVIMLVSYTTNNTGKPHKLALAANQGISLTFKIWSKTTRQVTFSELYYNNYYFLRF